MAGSAGGRTVSPPQQEPATRPVAGRQPDGHAWVAIIPALITLVVALYRIQRPSLWRDEGATLAAVHRRLPQLVRMLGHADAVHGAYYVLIWFETRAAGTSALALRFPSAAGMAVAAGLTTALGRRLVSSRAGLAAGLVFAALPIVTWYGQNARGYALVTALGATASYLLARAMEAPSARRWLAWYGVTVAAMGLGNIFALLLIPAHALTLALWARRDLPANSGALPAKSGAPPARAPAGGGPLVRGWLAAAGAAVLVVSPVIVISFGQRSQVSWLKPLDVARVASVARLLGPPGLAAVLLFVTVATFAFSALRGRLRADVPPRLLALGLPWLLLPPAVLLIASAVHPVFSPRYVVFCVPAAALLAGAGLASLGRAAAAGGGLALIVLAALPGQISDREADGHSENLRQLSHLVAAHSRPGDALLIPRLNDREFEAAYPAGYRSLRDIGLAQTPTQSATLLGTNAPTPVIRHRLATARKPSSRTSREASVTGIWLVLYTRPR